MIIKTKHCGYNSDGLRRLHIPGLFQQDAPDTSGMNKAAESNAALGKESLEWMKQVYADGAGDRAAASTRANAVSDAQLRMMDTQTGIAEEANNYQKSTFRPLEQQIVADANSYDTPERRQAAADAAVAGISMQADLARRGELMELNRRGVNPNSGQAMTVGSQMALSEALAKAGAANKARDQVETIGSARKMDAVSLGRGLSSNQATAASLALNAGNSSVGNAQVPLSVTQGGVSQMQSGYGQAMGANSSAASIWGNVGSLQNQANANETAYIGTMANIGMKAYGMSDKTKKTNRRKFSGKEALSMIHKMPVESWKYKPGVADGGHHIGPMAQDVQKAGGDDMAPGGKMIDLVSLNGLSLAAVQYLDQRLSRLEKRQPRLADVR